MTASAPSVFVNYLFALLILAATPACAESPVWHGFVSQRLTGSSHGNDFFGDTSGQLSTEYSELGLGLFWRPHRHWHLAGQAIARRGGDSEPDQVEADYLYAGYTPVENEHGHITFRLGKIKVPYGLYNELRDTPMTRPGILPPQSIYLDSLRQFNQSAQGLHFEAERLIGRDTVNLRLSQMKPNVESDNTFWVALGNRALFTGELYSRDNEALASVLTYDHDGGKLRGVLSHAQGRGHYRPGAADNWSGGQFDFAFSAISVQWNGQDVSLSAELARNDFDARYMLATPGQPDITSRDVGQSLYGQVQWRFAPRWEALLRYDINVANKRDKWGGDYRAATGIPAWTRYAKDWTVGARYRLDKHWQFAGELHRVEGTAWLPPADNLTNGAWDRGQTARHWNLLLLQATYQF